jgi:class 3 adenylate cyclase/tetratricopeptide (TPR) repeat protein
MAECQSCGAELPAGARFCASCGSAVRTGRPADAERRVVTILFVDLVGFTERSDLADPEDVRRTLLPYHERVKEDLERFGGTLDKFIGDAVMGVFGAPVAHEDDPVRAVRAGLRILGSMAELRRHDPELEVRIAVHTGEAVVSFGSGPQVGEAVAGDVVNTASRMQSLAPRGSMVIGATTLRAVRERFEVEPLAPAVVKGKREPLEVWRVLAERPDLEPDRSPFVGRERELAALTAVFDGAVGEGSCRIVTILAEAGVGKSRLMAELERRLGDRARRLTGSCPPYGEGVTFAPIEETVRALAGVEPSDDAAAVASRLDALTSKVEADPQDRRWLRSTLGVLLGLERSASGSPVPSEEIAQALARVLAWAAAERPLMLVLEDLHWAAAPLVEVLQATAELLASRPVLLLASARPDLREIHEAWFADRPGATTLPLGPLDEAEVRELLGRVLPADLESEASWRAVLRRSGGNPLYAIEFARMLGEAGGEDVEALATPASVHALIAARLDAIPSETRALLQDAAVIGEEVWAEALASLGDRSLAEVRARLGELERRALLEPRTSSFPDHRAHGFTHALIREVAYGRLPRAARARRHLAVATWLEEASGARAQEWSGSLARHYGSAAELGAAADETDVFERAREPALRWLLASGDRSARIDPGAAFAIFERALALAPAGSRARADVLWRSALAARRSGMIDADDVLARLLEGLEIARGTGDEIEVGEWLTRAGTQLAVTGEAERARAALAEAVEVLERHPRGRALARAYAFRAEEELFSGETANVLAFADRALALLEDETDEVAIMALHLRGDARCSTGDLDRGLADLGEALRRSEGSGAVSDVVTSRNYLAEWRWAVEGPTAGLAEWEMALELAERRNVRSQATYAKGGALSALLDAGEWDRALEWSSGLLALPAQRLDPAVSVTAHVTRTHVLLARGRRAAVVGADELLELAEGTQELHAIAPALVAAAAIAAAGGDAGEAGRRLAAFEATTDGVAPEYRAVELAHVVRLCLRVGTADIAERLVAVADPHVPRDRLRLDAARAMLAEAHRDPDAARTYAEIAERFRIWGNPFEEAMALLGHARLTGVEDPPARARKLLERLGVPTPWRSKVW